MKNLVMIDKDIDNEFNITISNNGYQWNSIYRNTDRGMCEIICRAFKDVGYKEVYSLFNENKEEGENGNKKM